MRLDNKGLALVFVLWVLVFLSVVAGSFSYSASRARRTVFAQGIQEKAYYIALAGFNRAVAAYIQSKKDEQPGIWRINSDIPSQKFGEGFYQVFISNESGKINLNEAEADLFNMLLSKSDLGDRDKAMIVNAILDWRDEDDLVRIDSAEKDYYSALPKPYAPRNGDFKAPTELLKVRGITEEVFNTFFKDRITVKADENDLLPKKSSIQEYLQLENRETTNGIQTFLTLEKRDELNRVGKSYDYSKININAASPGMLLSLPGMTEALVSQVIEFRKEKDFSSLSEFSNIVGPQVFAGLRQYISLALSRYYTISSVGWVAGSDIIQRVRMDIWVDNQKYDGYKVVQRY